MATSTPKIRAEFHNGLLCSWRCCDRKGMGDDELARHLAARHALGYEVKVLTQDAQTVPVEQIRVSRAQLEADAAELRACFEQIRIRREQLYAECPHPTRGSGGPMDPPGPRCAECGKRADHGKTDGFAAPGPTQTRGAALQQLRSLHPTARKGDWAGVPGRQAPLRAGHVPEMRRHPP
jgi:hypothetical protein